MVAHTKEPVMVPLTKEFVQPDGFPDTATVNKRTMDAMARLAVRGVVPQPNPLVTSFQLHALVKVLVRAKLLDQAAMDQWAYFTGFIQMQDLERLADEKPTSQIVVPAGVPRPKALLS